MTISYFSALYPTYPISPDEMGVDKKTLKQGNGQDFPKAGDTVSMEYTGWLYTETAPENKGEKYVDCYCRCPTAS